MRALASAPIPSRRGESSTQAAETTSHAVTVTGRRRAVGGISSGPGKVRATPRQRGEPPERGAGRALGPVRLTPQLAEALDAGQRRVRREEGAVDRADGGAEHDVRVHASLGKRAQHAHLVRTEHAPSAEDEGEVACGSICCHVRTGPAVARRARAPGTPARRSERRSRRDRRGEARSHPG